MYYNDVHIGYYIAAAIIGLFVGQFVSWLNKRLPEHKRVISLDMFREFKRGFKPNYILMLVNAIIYVTLIYVFGISDTFAGNIDLIKYLILTPMLLSVFVIDYRLQIIPNRLNLSIFEIGLIFTFIAGWFDVAIALNMLLGMLVGAGIFLLITLVGGLFYGKDAMGFGDVKLMGALGLYFGLSNIIIVIILSFLIGAILSILLLLVRAKKKNEYVAFGPFIVLASFTSMYVPFETIRYILIKIFTLGMYG